MKQHRATSLVVMLMLLLVSAGQAWSMYRAYDARSPIVVSDFHLDFRKCKIDVPDLALALSSVFGMSSEEHAFDVVRSDDKIHVLIKSTQNGDDLFARQKAYLEGHLDCGTSVWCEGLAPDSEYSASRMPLVEEKRRGVKVALPGCEVSEQDFNAIGWSVKQSPSGVSALDCVSLGINFLAIACIGFPIWRKSRKD
jgi:hypothetical protein